MEQIHDRVADLDVHRARRGGGVRADAGATRRRADGVRRGSALPLAGGPPWPCGWPGARKLRAAASDPETAELTRYRKTQITARASEIARLEKVLGYAVELAAPA